MFSQVCVKNSVHGGVRVHAGMHGEGCICGKESMHGEGGMHEGGMCMAKRGMCGKRGACISGKVAPATGSMHPIGCYYKIIVFKSS